MRGRRGEAPTSQWSRTSPPHLFQRRLRLHRWELLQAANWELIEAEIVALQLLRQHIEFVFDLLQKTYDISKEDMIILKSEYNFDIYIKKIIPIIDKEFHLTEFKEAFSYLKSGKHFGKICIKL